ncbi:MAG TPA: RNA polymerase sigma factor [Polyangiaceae bacterium]
MVSDEGFQYLVVEHHGEIYRYLVRITGRSTDADDLSQETFLRAFRAYASGKLCGDARAWLFAIATNLMRNHFRSQKRRQRAHDAMMMRDVATEPDGASGREVGEIIEEVVAELPLKQRAAFLQRKVHGFEYDTIAKNLGCSPDSARANVFQATKKIRRALDGSAKRVDGKSSHAKEGP